jgi:hypothetical protein
MAAAKAVFGEAMLGARIFVTVSFLVLGLSFLASTAVTVQEFQNIDWLTILVAHSHLFFFFPVLGVLALFAFYLPSVVFAHFYWNHVPYGKVRFLVGLVLVAALSYGVSRYLDGPPRALWEVTPAALAADGGDQAAGRAPMLATLRQLRSEAQKRVGLSNFARNCAKDDLMEVPDEMLKERYCFPARALLKGRQCCEVQRQFELAVSRLYDDPSQRSLSSRYDVVFLPMKVFFVLIVVAIAVLLAVWRDRIDGLYRELIPRLERGIIIGGFSMLFWPAMDYGYQQTANVLFGRNGAGPQLRLSLIVAPWALLLLFYFLRRLGKQGEMIGQISGVVVAAVAVLRYEQLNDWVVRLFGIGAHPRTLIGLVVASVAGVLALLWFRYSSRYPEHFPPRT